MTVKFVWRAVALILMAGSIVPSFHHDFWSATTPAIRWTIWASQILMLAAGMLHGWNWGRS